MQYRGNDDIQMELVKCITEMKCGISRAAFHVATVVELKSYCRAPAVCFKKSDIFMHTCERKTSHCSFLKFSDSSWQQESHPFFMIRYYVIAVFYT